MYTAESLCGDIMSLSESQCEGGAMRYRLNSLVMLLIGALASPVKASEIAVPPPPPAPSDWIVTIGADGRAIPRYMGSNAWAMVPVPYFDMRRLGSPEGFHAPVTESESPYSTMAYSLSARWAR